MDYWDLALMVIAGFVAMSGLARLMNWRRNQLIGELMHEVEQQKQRRPSGGAEPPQRPNKTA